MFCITDCSICNNSIYKYLLFLNVQTLFAQLVLSFLLPHKRILKLFTIPLLSYIFAALKSSFRFNIPVNSGFTLGVQKKK